MKKEEKIALRIKVCKDVLEQIKSGKYDVSHGIYCDIHTDNPIKNGVELQKILSNVNVCEVCALGSLFMSLVKFKDKYKVKGNDQCVLAIADYDIEKKLKSLWSNIEMGVIESSFEFWYREKSVSYINHNLKGEKRLISIMENIIKNNGEVTGLFTPEYLYETWGIKNA